MSKKVTIVGGGPAGMAAARAILAESPDFIVHVFEARVDFGGLWNYSPVYGPMYRDLTANVSRKMIGFTGFPFPGEEDDPSYPSRQEVRDYIRKYSNEISRDPRITVSLNTKVASVVKDPEGKKWVTTTEEGDAVASEFLLLATGHYEFPFWPNIPGLRNHTGSLHSVDYNSPEEFQGKRVLLLGNSRSGTDILIQLLSRAAPITVSRRQEGPVDYIFDEHDAGSVIWKPEVQKVIGHAVYFTDGTCQVFDRIVVCTGYLYDFPFLNYDPHPLKLLDKTRLRLHNFYRHTIFAGDSTLATIGMNKGMVPFPTFETQAEVISRVWSGRLHLPDESVMLKEEEQTAEARGLPEKFHNLPMGLDVEFMRTLWAWADEAPGNFRADRWDDTKLGLRETGLKAKLAQDILNLTRSKEIRSRTQPVSGHSELPSSTIRPHEISGH